MQSLGYSTTVYKPIQTSGIEINGFTQSPDLTLIKSIDPYVNTEFTYLFRTNTEPLIASEKENKIIDVDFINSEYQKIINNYDCTLVDSDFGLFSPLSKGTIGIDLLKRMQIPILFAVSPNEISISNLLLTINTAQEKGLCIRGVIINNISNSCANNTLTDITRIIEEYTNIKILGLVPNMGTNVKPEELISAILNGIDIESIFNVKIEKLDFN